MSEESVPTRSKRQVSKQLSTRLSALDKLRSLRGGKNKYELAEKEDVYEVVDEDKYCDLVLQRQRDDWIVDDDGQGYNDNGREIFDDDFDEHEVNDRRRGDNDRKKVPLNRSNNEEVRKRKKNDLPNMFKNMESNKKGKSINEVTIDEKALEELMEDTSKASRNNSSRYAKSGPSMMSTPIPLKLDKKRSLTPNNSNPFALTPKASNSFSTSNNSNPLNFTPKASNSFSKRANGYSASLPKKRLNNSTQELDFDSILDASDIAEINKQKQTNQNQLITKMIIDSDDNNKNTVSTDEKVSTLSEGDWVSSKNEIQSISMPTVLPQELPYFTDSQNNKCIKFYWFDAFNDYFKNPSVVYLFGKVFIKELKRHVSCCIQVKNIERRIYLLPRDNFLNDSSRKVTLQDVYNEFNDDIAKRYKITQFRSRKVTKRYSFDIPDVPEEADYLEILYSANFAALPAELNSGNTFRQVFGANTSGLENLILDCKLKGPAWLLIKNPVLSDPPVSWCKLELIVNKSNAQIVVDSEQTESPDFTLISLNLRTYLHPISKSNEIIAISCLVNRSFSFDKPNSKIKYDSHFCVVSKPSTNSGLVLPYDFTPNMAIKRYNRTKIEIMNSERELLNYFMAKLLQLDPDIIVGHDIYHFDYDLILSRFSYHKLSMSWSKLGRLKRSGIPIKSKDKNSICGRLVCDIKISSKELIRAKSYDLTHLSAQILRKGRFDISQQLLPQFFSTSEQLFRLIDLTMKDNEFILNIMYELNALPLALQITSIAGNLLSRTLLGGRSERNEYLLLHAFHEKNFICPNKVYSNSKVQEVDNDNYDEAIKATNKSKGASRQRKAAYTGGLVLEPKVGFYDRFILLMDFLSLYPSIIQEFNICFTTVCRQIKPSDKEKDDDEEYIPNVPDSNLNEGILPNEIKKLVDSRREVKKLMCDPNLSPELKQQYDIRQKALKLTANSMYGCLGFSFSRFYAKPLAALITFKGREILMNTKQLVETLGLEVIYGDTDSIMILTNCVSYDDVKNIGNKVQAEVNRLYKLLEIEIDGVFRSMLLLKKKKYAALTVQKMSNGELTYTKEVKGLDIVRRDWSMLAKNAGEHILDEILSLDKSSDVIVENIHNYMKTLSESIRNDGQPIDDFIISKALTKNPEDYADKKGLSHVSVALRYNELNKGKKLRNGDTVPYVICNDGSSAASSQRAYHPEELNDNPNLKIDVKYYLSQQIHPVVSRLCDPIDGTDAHILAELLGLESSAPRNHFNNTIIENAFESGESRFDMCRSLMLNCVECSKQIEIRRTFKDRNSFGNENKETRNRLELTFARCPHCNVEFNSLNFPQFEMQIRLFINSFIREFYKKWLLCEDKACLYRTRYFTGHITKEGLKCPKCKFANLYPEMSDFQLYHQLCFFKYLFDLNGAVKRLTSDEDKADGNILQARFGEFYNRFKSVIDKYLKNSAYNEIDLTSIFRKIRNKMLNSHK